MKKLKIIKSVKIDEEALVKIGVKQGVLENKFNWKLVRDSDTLKAKSKEVMWIEWDETGRFKAKHQEPALGRSLLMSPFNQYFTWQTTQITSFQQQGDEIVFSTKNSNYTLTKINLYHE